jgi:hypothetical protein
MSECHTKNLNPLIEVSSFKRRPPRLDREGIEMPNPPETKSARPLTLLSVVIPARDEEGCIASTIEHLHPELALYPKLGSWDW